MNDQTVLKKVDVVPTLNLKIVDMSYANLFLRDSLKCNLVMGLKMCSLFKHIGQASIFHTRNADYLGKPTDSFDLCDRDLILIMFPVACTSMSSLRYCRRHDSKSEKKKLLDMFK